MRISTLSNFQWRELKELNNNNNFPRHVRMCTNMYTRKLCRDHFRCQTCQVSCYLGKLSSQPIGGPHHLFQDGFSSVQCVFFFHTNSPEPFIFCCCFFQVHIEHLSCRSVCHGRVTAPPAAACTADGGQAK